MRLRSLGLPLLLLSGLLAEILQEREVRGIVGSSVVLPCVHPERNSFDLNDLYVYWQIGKTVVTYYLPGDSSGGHKASQYRGRTQLPLHTMQHGDFSLRLFNVTPHDEQEFSCLVFRKSLAMAMVLGVTIRLHVAANYSMPVVSAPSSASPDELTFTCTATNGYPRPNVYWINETDGSLLPAALQNSTAVRNARGLYDVVSVLRLGQAPRLSVRCCVENVLLSQNLTVSSQAEPFNGTKDRIVEKPVHPQQNRHTVVLSLCGALAILALVVGWLWRGHCTRERNAGAQGAGPELELADHNETTVPLGHGRCHQESHQTVPTSRTLAA
ncbi:ICOS ligand [Tamandua tetradactyla]|uniref:ICOS ligand n=1 Tax=Tamandua tetradactyla TaxID=48850 RepID=UPI0040540522